MDTAVRNLVSRAAAGVIGLALVYGGWRCVSKGIDFVEDANARAADRDGRDADRTRKNDGSALPFMAGGLMLIIGVPTAAYALLPHNWIAGFLQPKPMGFGDD